MQIERSPFLKLDRQQVIGYFKAAGTKDPDVLHTQKKHLVSLGKFPKYVGIWAITVGSLMTLLILTAIIGIPMIGLGIWLWSRGNKNLKAIELGFEEFTGTAQETSPTAAIA